MGLVSGSIILPPARKLAGGIIQVFSALPEDLIWAVPDARQLQAQARIG